MYCKLTPTQTRRGMLRFVFEGAKGEKIQRPPQPIHSLPLLAAPPTCRPLLPPQSLPEMAERTTEERAMVETIRLLILQPLQARVTRIITRIMTRAVTLPLLPLPDPLPLLLKYLRTQPRTETRVLRVTMGATPNVCTGVHALIKP